MHVYTDMTGEAWTTRHVGEATGELSKIKWEVRNPSIRESHVAGATGKKGAKNGCKKKLLFIVFILGKDIVLEL